MKYFNAKVDANHADIVKEFRRLGAHVRDVHQLKNWVDVQVSYRGVTVMVEIKMPDKPLQADQEALKEELESYGALHATIRSIEEAKGLIESIYEHTPNYKEPR